MDPTIKYLNVSHQASIPEKTRNTLAEMADNLPFEKKRSRELEIDQEHHAQQVMKNESPNCDFYLAKYPDGIVGGIVYETLQTENENNILRVHKEWIQRNRTDIRQSIYRKISSDFPGTYILITYPAQNRTARHEVSNFSFAKTINTQKFLYFSQILPRQSSPDNIPDSPVQLETLQTPETELSGFKIPNSDLDSVVNLQDSGNGPKPIEAITREIPSGAERGNIIQIRGLNASGKIRASRLLSPLERNCRKKNYSSLEFILAEENTAFRNVLEKSNYILRNKRIAWMGTTTGERRRNGIK